MAAAQSPDPTLDHDRVVHRFDFTEPDNLYPQPKHWIRFPDPSLPIYPDRTFPRSAQYFRDQEAGHDGAPALYIDPKARNAAIRYKGIETSITPGDYVVTGWIRPDRLTHARAAISAYYLDWRKRPIPHTQRFSPLIGVDPVRGDAWQQVRIEMETAPPEALAIGVTCWVIQQDVWRDKKAPYRHIPLRDAQGGAWFDDIVILGQPQMRLDFLNDGNVVELPNAPVFRTLVRDVDPTGLEASLRVFDSDANLLFESPVTVTSFSSQREADRFEPHIDQPGIYTAILDVTVSDKRVAQRQCRFAVLQAFDDIAPFKSARHIGITLPTSYPESFSHQLALMDAIGCGRVKAPLWPRQNTSDPEHYAEWLTRYLASFGSRQLKVVGLIADPPSDVDVGDKNSAEKLIELLSTAAPLVMQPVSAFAAANGTMLVGWQIGADAEQLFSDDARTPDAISNTRTVLAEMVNSPAITIGGSVAAVQSNARFADALSVHLPADVQPEFIDQNLAPYLSSGQPVSVTLPLPESHHGNPELVLNRWALRVMNALFAGPNSVNIPAPWSPYQDRTEWRMEPNRAMVAYRTISRLIGDAAPHRRLSIGDVHAISFQRRDHATVVLWNQATEMPGHTLEIQLGDSAAAFDIEGRHVALARSPKGVHRVPVGPYPLIVTGVDPWLIALIADTSLAPNQVAFRYAPSRHDIAIENTSSGILSGEIQFQPPDGWQVEPSRRSFSSQPGERTTISILLRQSGNESAGDKFIRAELRLASEPAYLVPLVLPLQLGADDLEVWGYAVYEAGRVVVRHGIVNQSDQPQTLRAFAAYPGQSRRYRALNNLRPGESMHLDYRFNVKSTPVDRVIRLGVRRLDGTQVHNLHVPVQ